MDKLFKVFISLCMTFGLVLSNGVDYSVMAEDLETPIVEVVDNNTPDAIAEETKAEAAEDIKEGEPVTEAVEETTPEEVVKDTTTEAPKEEVVEDTNKTTTEQLTTEETKDEDALASEGIEEVPNTAVTATDDEQKAEVVEENKVEEENKEEIKEENKEEVDQVEDSEEQDEEEVEQPQIVTSEAPSFNGAMMMRVVSNEATVSSWEELEQAVNNENVDTITIDADLAANKTITIPSGKTITLKGNKTIYREYKGHDSTMPAFLSMFVVENRATLNVEDGLKFSGKTAVVNGEEITAPEATATYTLNKVEHMDCAAMGDWTSGPNDFNGRHFVIKNKATNEILTVSGDGTIVKHEYPSLKFDGAEFSEEDLNTMLDSEGLSNSIFETTYYGKSSMTWFFKFVNTYNGKGTGKILSTIKEGRPKSEWPVTAIDPNDSRIADWELNGKPGTIAATFVKKGTDNDGNNVENEFKFYYLNRRKENQNLGDDGWSRYLGTNKNSSRIVTSCVPINPDKKYTGVEVFELVKNESTPSTPESKPVVDQNSIEDAFFNAEDLGNPTKGGFFIQNNGGIVNIDNAVFKEMTITSGEGTPKNIAPIYNIGGQFTMKSGSIENNKLEDFSDLKSNVTGRELNALIKKHPVNNNTGAIVFENGAVGTISGGDIQNNKGMIGAIKVDGSELNLTRTAKIHDNEGSHYTGAIFIDHEGEGVTMDGNVEIYQNLSWRNGAVFTHLHPNDTFKPNDDGSAKIGGRFTMNGGKIHDNTSYDKGGAIRIKSNGVSLNGGEIYNNTSRVMGGAIYVDGDSPKRSRTLKLENAAIYGNKALGKDAPELGGNTDVAFPKDNADGRPGYLQSGCGGGVWTCPFGTLVFNGETVNIGENTAAREGDDFHKDNGLSGALILTDMPETWINQDGGEMPNSEAKPIDGVVNLKNNGNVEKEVTGVKIYNNTSRRGGGVAANGTLIFGKIDKQERNQAVLNFKKVWAEGTPTENVKFKFSIVAEDGTTTELGTYTMNDGTSTDKENELDSFEQIEPWTVQIMLPNSYNTKNGEKPFYDTTLNEGTTISKTNWKLQAEEIDTGNKYVVDYSDVTLANKDTLENVSEMIDKSGNHLKTTITFNKFTFEQTATNSTVAPAKLTVIAKKQLNGEEIKTDSDYDKKFEFTLTQTSGPELSSPALPNVVKNNGSEVKFEGITFDKVGIYSFKITEVIGDLTGISYDTKDETFSVNVTADPKDKTKLIVTDDEGTAITSFNAQHTFNNKKATPHNVYFSKVDLTGNKLPGATIELFAADAEGNATGTALDKWVSIDDVKTYSLVEGDYVIKETKVPEGFEEAKDIKLNVTSDGKLTVNGKKVDDNDQSNPITMVDGYKDQIIKISKVKLGGETLPGAKITVTGKIKGSNEIITPISWKSESTAKELKLKPGTYTFTEDSAPAGYDVVTAFEFNVNEDGSITTVKTTVDNVEIKGDTIKVTDQETAKQDVKFSKQDIGGNELSGATINVYEVDKDGKQIGEAIETWESDGKVHDFKLKPGSYVFVETAAPNGYEIATSINFTLQDDGKIKVGETVLANTDKEHVVMVDGYKDQSVKISKVKLGGEALPGAKITVTGKIKGSNEEITPISWESESTAKELTLKPGTYTFTEDAAPAGYDVVTAFKFNVDEDGSITTVKTTVDNVEIKGDTIEVTDQETAKQDVKFSKQDIGGNELSGATIEVYGVDKDGEKIGKAIETWESDRKVHDFKLKPGSYVFVETAAPNGYEIATSINFTLQDDGKIKVGETVLANTDKEHVVMVDGYKDQSVKISKVKLGGEALPGAKITVTGKIKGSNKEITPISWESGSTAKELTLKPGTYTFTEDAAPAGYDVVTAFEFNVNEDGSITTVKTTVNNEQAKVDENGVLVVTDAYSTEKTTISVEKKWVGKAADQVTVKLMADGKELKSVELNKGNNWKAEFNGLFIYDQSTGKKIDYTVNESLDGYTTAISGNTTDGFVVKNTKEQHDVVISKVDLVGTPLVGAKIKVEQLREDKTKLLIESWTTSKYEKTLQLKPGTYVFTEDAAPAGYEVVTSFKFTVGIDGTVKLEKVKVNDVELTGNKLIITDRNKPTQPEKPNKPHKPEVPNKPNKPETPVEPQQPKVPEKVKPHQPVPHVPTVEKTPEEIHYEKIVKIVKREFVKIKKILSPLGIPGITCPLGLPGTYDATYINRWLGTMIVSIGIAIFNMIRLRR